MRNQHRQGNFSNSNNSYPNNFSQGGRIIKLNVMVWSKVQDHEVENLHIKNNNIIYHNMSSSQS